MPTASRFRSRLKYTVSRARAVDLASVWQRAGEVADQHRVGRLRTFADMMTSAAFHDTPFQDYVDWEFATLSRAERETFMTHALSNRIAQRFAHPDFRGIFHDKIAFNEAFGPYLGREWIDLRTAGAEALGAFVTSHGTIFAKEPVSSAGIGVARYTPSAATDFGALHAELIAKGQILVEEQLPQHAVLAAICPGTVNTTRITTFFDGTETHLLSAAQKFGRGQASDQQTFGGFYTMLDENGHSCGRGYDSHGHVHSVHPESGVSIPDFTLPRWDEAVAFIKKVGAVVPQVQYVGWDIVVGDDGIALIEGNWGAGVYENRPSITGHRTGSRPRFEQVIGRL